MSSVSPAALPHPALNMDELRRQYAELQARGLRLDLTRGKPSSEQLDLSEPMLALPTPGHHYDADGADVRNYGGLTGLPQLRRIFAELFNIPVTQLLALGNSSLTLMHDTLAYAFLWGVPGSPCPWTHEPTVKFICPTPGYDRHFALCEAFGIEMLPVSWHVNGPDVDQIADLVAHDPTVKGMWLVPTYSNPTGTVTSAAVAQRLMEMPTAAPDFRIFWDNAYALHHLGVVETPSANALQLAEQADNPDRVFCFASTSKMTFPGAGVAFWAGSPTNINWFTTRLSKQAIGPDKVNQLRHALFFGDAEGVRHHMAKHRAVLAPKFAAVDRILSHRLTPTGIDARWSKPTGGYFVSLDTPTGTATRVVELAAGAGIALTPAGSTWPYGRDPLDSNLRIAPSMPTLPDVEQAIDALATCILLATAEN